MNVLPTLRLRLTAIREDVAESLWFLPTVTTVLAVVAAEVLGRVGVAPSVDGAWFFNGGPESARTILGTISGSMITVTGLTFSLTVVALQVASGQFTPRLLRTFLGDRGNQVVLSAFIATFAYSLLLLRHVRSVVADAPASVPGPAVSVAIVMVGVCVGLLVYFVHHLTTQLRVETVMIEVATDTIDTIDSTHPPDAQPTGGGLPDPPDDAWRLPAGTSGYLRDLDLDVLFRVGSRAGVNIRLRPGIGDHVTRTTTLAWAWPVDEVEHAVGPPEVDVERLTQGVHDAIQLGAHRSLSLDVAFGIRQLVDIAVRALSPGVNDPTTAVEAVHHLTDVLVELGQRPLHHLVRNDDRVVVGVPRPDFAAHLDLAQRQIRRYGASEPSVVLALAGSLRDLAETVDTERLEAVTSQLVALEEAVGAAGLQSADAGPVGEVLDAVEQVLRGRVGAVEALAD